MPSSSREAQTEASNAAANVEDVPMQQLKCESRGTGVGELPEVSNATPAVTPVEVTPLVRLKVLSAAFAFFNTGINDGSLGALVNPEN